MTQDTPDQGDVPASSELTGLVPDAQPIPLSAQQRALIHALDIRSSGLSAMYLGGMRALSDASNPERFVHCAHSLRELMEKLPELLDVPTKAQKESLKTKVIELQGTYVDLRKRTSCFSISQGWDGNIDALLRKFLQRVDKFFVWFEMHHPRRRDEVNGLLMRLDGSGRELPPSLSSLNVKAWQLKRDYFQSVAHHGVSVDEKDFRGWVDALEKFLLDRFEPRTFDDFSEIDVLLGKGE